MHVENETFSLMTTKPFSHWEIIGSSWSFVDTESVSGLYLITVVHKLHQGPHCQLADIWDQLLPYTTLNIGWHDVYKMLLLKPQIISSSEWMISEFKPLFSYKVRRL